MVFVRKREVNGRTYHYIVSSTRIGGNKWKKVEHYVGLHPPSKEEIKKFEEGYNQIKHFLTSRKELLQHIRKIYQQWKPTKDQREKIENEIITLFTYETSKIEGSTLSYKDTKLLLQEGISPTNKPIRDIKETENHKEAFFYVKKNLNKEITKEVILDLHRILKQNVTEDAGQFRDAQVYVGDLVPIRADMIETEIKNLLVWYQGNEHLHPLERACIFHTMIERIHPFFDGNGRVGRLLMNFTLLKAGYPIVIIQNKNKKRYYNALRRADDGNHLYMLKLVVVEMEHFAKKYY
jgi:Fic family protein